MSKILLYKLCFNTINLTINSLTSRFPLYRRKHSQVAVVLNMNEAFINHENNSNVFDISFRYVDPRYNLDRQFNFVRQTNEPVNNFLQRIDHKISQCIEKKMKKKRKKQNIVEIAPEEDNICNEKIKFVRDNMKISGEIPCKLILDNHPEIKLIVFDTEYTLKVNVPTISDIALPSSILVGFPVYPSKFKSKFTDKKKSRFVWYKRNILDKSEKKWTEVGEGFSYIPHVSDIGYHLKMICVPRNNTQSGPSIEVLSSCPVDAGPGRCPFDARHESTKIKLSAKSFRIISYNILADTYSDSDYSREILFPYCPAYALNMDYRKQLILKELMGFNADFMCLQEVDSKIYENDLLPFFSILNFGSIYHTKNKVQEGLATFFNQERFDILNSEHSVISQGTDLNEFNAVWSQIRNETVKERFLNRSTIVQITTVKSKENPHEILIIGNTHLYFHPDADHIRLLQGYYVITYLRKVSKETKKRYSGCNISVILCGDFNSVPECGIYKLMTENYVPENFVDWSTNPSEKVENIELVQDLRLASACGTPEYTNYTPEFSGCLDYIFYQQDYLEVEHVVPLPTKEEITLHKGLPSVVSPSDHISLCADLRWLK